MDNGEEQAEPIAGAVTDPHPWPYLDELFELIGEKNNGVTTMQAKVARGPCLQEFTV